MENRVLMLTDGTSFNLYTSFINIENPLDHIKGTLKEYTLTEQRPDQQMNIYTAQNKRGLLV